MPGHAALLELLLPKVEGEPRAMVALARQFVAAGERKRALALAERVFAMTAGEGEAGTLAAEILSDGVHNWHFLIPRDRARNDAYEEALRRAIWPGCKVLEIGSGSGLLAMMAARAGAEVVTCEADPAIASAARNVVAANGYADRVRVVNKHSSALDPDADLGGRADILVSEIVSNDLLSEGVLAAHEDAIARLVKPGARVIPARGAIRVALASEIASLHPGLGETSGFDLSAFNRLSEPFLIVRVGRSQVELRSEPANLFSFAFGSGGPWEAERTELSLASSGGRVDGIVQWIALEMDGEGSYENRPAAGAASCWGARFRRFSAPIETRSNELVEVGGAHDRDRVRFWRNKLRD